jgi:ubiquinone/menaquinone biosynthesis C-methylase UbiE
MDDYAHKLYIGNFIRISVIRRVIGELNLPSGSKGLDAGCGIGSLSMMLAEAVGHEGHVTGLDISPDFLKIAKKNAEKSGMSSQVSFQQGDVTNLPFEDESFDWVWSSDCIGYPYLRSSSQIKELARVIKPGGIIAILSWSSQRFLPGYDLLEARLNLSCSGTAPYITGKKPEELFMRAQAWFREAGLTDIKAHTFAGDVQAPLDNNLREALAAFFEMLWGDNRSMYSDDDWAEYQRLCLPDSPDFIANLPDYYGFFTYTMFSGIVGLRSE